MTSTPNTQPTPPAVPPAPNPEPFLSLHTTVVLLTALVLGFIIGSLTAFTGVHPAAAAIAGLTTAGASTAALRTLIR
ncbi:hypothetical protein ABZT45_27005 [Streptomyces sp. NPDC005356]|uniref:hypothetical protein n=1 Tax=Streptomyces sp. NPDC005356 TaxID=3157167 RepID=UPI00339F28B0